MSDGREQVSLANLGNGAAIELFDIELRRALENILDPNTKSTAKREITLKVTFKPDDDRDYSAMTIQCNSKLAPVSPFPTNVYIGKERGEPVAYEHNPKQLNLFDQQPIDGVVVEMRTAKEVE